MLQKISLLILGFVLTLSSFAQTDSGKTYKMVVSFHSIGTGVPGNQPIKDYIKKFKKANRIKSISADRIGPLGREGEYKLAFRLKELTKKQQILFIKRIKQVTATMTDRGKADVLENETWQTGSMPSRATITTEKF